MYRVTVENRVTTVLTSCGILTKQSCRSHLTACHTEDTVVDENNGNVFVAGSGVDSFGSADAGKVAVTLVREDDFVRVNPFDTCSNGRSPTVSSFRHIAVEVVIRKNRAAYRSDTDDVFSRNVKFAENFRNKSVNNAVGACLMDYFDDVVDLDGLMENIQSVYDTMK